MSRWRVHQQLGGVAAAAAMALLAACGGDDTGAPRVSTTVVSTTVGATTVTSTTVAPTTVVPTTVMPTTTPTTAGAPSSLAPGTTAGPTTTALPTTVAAASCDEDVLLDVVRVVLVPENPAIIGSVTVGACQNGYAQVFALPTETNLEGEQLFLADRRGVWEVVDFGTGIDCNDPSFPVEEMLQACIALGLRDP